MNKHPVYVQHIERVEDLNNRIYSRNVPSGKIQASINTRPVSTKYSVMPIMDMRANQQLNWINAPRIILAKPLILEAPKAHGAAFHNINDESRLRNSFLQYRIAKSRPMFHHPIVTCMR